MPSIIPTPADAGKCQNFGPEVKHSASIYVPAIGKVTVVILLRNLLRIVQNRRIAMARDAANIHQPINT